MILFLHRNYYFSCQYCYSDIAFDNLDWGTQKGNRDSGFVFKSHYNTVLSPHGVNRGLDCIIKAYNAREEQKANRERRNPELLPHFSSHNLRYTFCTRFCENETNLKIIQEIMGYADITTMMDIYNEATKEEKLESFAELEVKIKVK